MSLPDTPCPLLDPKAAEVLASFDAYAETMTYGKSVTIRDEEGAQLFIVTPGISAADLGTMLRMRPQLIEHGRMLGRADMAADFRRLLGAAPV